MQNIFFNSDSAFILELSIGIISLSILITLFFFSSKNKALIERHEGVVTTFYSLPAVLFSLTAALLATSVWDNYSIGMKAINTESQGILDVISLADSVPALQKINLPASAKAYTQSIIDDEWKTLSISRSSSPITEKKFISMRSDIFMAVNLLSDKVESKALLNAYYTINNAREARLAYASFDLHPIRWYAILFLGVLVLVSVAFGHASKPKSLLVAMPIATLTILTPLCVLAFTFSSPYQGVIAISNNPYLQIIK